MKSPAVLVLALLTAIGGSGCNGGRLIPRGAWSPFPSKAAREEKAMRAIYGDGYEKAKAEMDAARLAAWMLSWEDGPPVHLSDQP